jgi:pimeloyl-ACP methyl ester carboxylesterase
VSTETWLLLPGLDGTGRLFHWFADAMPPEQPRRIVDYPPHPQWRIDDFVDHVAGLLASEARVLLIAESFSGPIALRVLQKARNVTGVVFVASFSHVPSRLLEWIPSEGLLSLAQRRMPRAALRFFCAGWDTPAPQIDALQAVIAAMPPDLLRARLRLLRELAETASVRSAVPILRIVASQDRLVARSRWRVDGGAVTTTVMPGPHFLLQTQTRECLAEIRRWRGTFA